MTSRKTRGTRREHAAIQALEKMGAIGQCEQCEARLPPQRTRFCSVDCYSIARRIIRYCEGCGQVIKRRGSATRFCSRSCFNKTKPIRIHRCWYCQREFARPRQYKPSEAVYCSSTCQGKSLAKRVEKRCFNCNGIILVRPSRLRNARGKFCTRRCTAEWKSRSYTGASNPNWRGGIARKKGTGVPARAYEKGKRKELKTRRMLEAQGYYVIRSGGSRGVWDLVAYQPSPPFGACAWRCIQVKTHGQATPAERQKIGDAQVPGGTSKELWVWRDNHAKPAVTFF